MSKSDNREVISKSKLWLVATICVAISIMLALQLWTKFKFPIEEDSLGTYGNFIEGIVGCIIAFYSAYLLVRTFQNQVEVNRNVMKTNETAEKATQQEIYNTKIQVFDNKFQSFMTCYNRAVEAYRYQSGEEKYVGRNAFEMMCKDFLDRDFKNDSVYSKRSRSAVAEYVDFYSKNRVYLAVHLRMLYLLVSLVSESNLDDKDKDKVLYAKLIRGQLSEFEMIMLRYNCLCSYGQKMQRYCNEFNLTKHVPIMQLLEFKKYHKVLLEAQPNANKEELVAGLDGMFIILRKNAKTILNAKKVYEIAYNDCKSYTLTMRRSTDSKEFDFVIEKKEINRRGGGERLTATEKALDRFTEEQLLGLFRDFLSELFFTSNFNNYNEDADIVKGPIERTENTFTCRFTIKSKQPIVLSAQCMKKRDKAVKK